MKKQELINKIRRVQRKSINLQKKMILSKKFLSSFNIKILNEILMDEELDLYETEGDYESFEEQIK